MYLTQIPQITTQITIHLVSGDNYFSFPATSSNDFGTLINGISNYVETKNGQKLFYRYDPIIYNDFVYVDASEHIEKGLGYLIKMTAPADLIYDGVEYTLSFDQLRSMLITGSWNLVGTGSNRIFQPNWCKILDPITRASVSQIDPYNAYWINYNDCSYPTLDPLVLIFSIGLGISIISLFISLKGTKTSDESIV